MNTLEILGGLLLAWFAFKLFVNLVLAVIIAVAKRADEKEKGKR